MTHSQLETEKRVLDLFLSQLNLEVPSPETDLIAEGLLDSLLLVEALMHIEREFGIQLSLAELDLDTFRSVRTISVYIQSQLGGDDARAVGED